MNRAFSFRFLLAGLVLSFVVNLFLFSVLPNLLSKDNPQKTDVEFLNPINMVSFDKFQKQPEKENLVPDKPEPEMAKESAPKSFMELNQPEIENMDIPFELNINPVLKVGVPINISSHKFKGTYNQGDVDKQPMVMFRLKPMYPYRAKRMNINGQVDVKFLVDSSGNVSKITILKANPPGIFESSVKKALLSWRFSPGEISGQSVFTWVKTTIEFNMEDS